MTSSESGSRGSAVTLRRERPSPLRSVPSGRDSTSRKMAWSPDHSSRWSRKSTMPASAHCRSSTTMTTGRYSDSRSKKSRQPEKSSSLAEHLRARQAEQLAEARGDELPVGRIGDPALEAGAEPLGDEVERVLLADLQPGTDHLRQRPVAHALAVGEAAPGVPEDVAGEAVDVLEELPGEARLADAGDARDEHESGRVALGGGVEELLDEAKLVVAADEAAPRARPERCEPATAAMTRVAWKSRTGSALPLSSCSPAST